LIERVKKGDRDSFEQLINQYSKNLCNYIKFRVKNDADVNDILQDAMLSIWQSIATYEYGSSFKTWIFSITRRRIADFYRSRHDVLPLADYEESFEINDEIEERIDIDRALSRLSDKDNELLHLIFQAQLSYHEISELIGIPVGTIKSRMSGIKAKLKKMLSWEE